MAFGSSGAGAERSRGGGKKANSRINTSAPLYDGTLWIYPRSRRGCCVPRALLTQPPENVNAGSSPFLISSCFSLFYHCQAPSLSLALLSLSSCPTSLVPPPRPNPIWEWYLSPRLSFYNVFPSRPLFSTDLSLTPYAMCGEHQTFSLHVRAQLFAVRNFSVIKFSSFFFFLRKQKSHGDRIGVRTRSDLVESAISTNQRHRPRF